MLNPYMIYNSWEATQWNFHYMYIHHVSIGALKNFTKSHLKILVTFVC